MTTKAIKKKRNALWHQDPRCCYCGTLTIRVEDFPLEKGETVPMNMATLDHVYNVNHPFREKEEFVLACHECNAIKSMIECQDVNLEVHKEKTIKKLMIINRMIEFEKDDNSTAKTDGKAIQSPSSGLSFNPQGILARSKEVLPEVRNGGKG